MSDKLKAFCKKNKTVLSVTLFMIVFLGLLAGASMVMSSRRQSTATPTADPAATATPDPYVIMQDLWGDWERVDANPTGIVALSLHGDNTAVYTLQDAFEPEPRRVSTRWQAQAWVLSMFTEGPDGGEITQYSFSQDGDTLVLTDGYGHSVTFRRVTSGETGAETAEP